MEDNNILKSGSSNDQDVLLVRPFENPPFQNPDFLNHTHNGLDSPRIFANNVMNIAGAAQSATFVIGPASNADSSSYDYVTDGTDDNVQIQAAIDALPTNGGSICLREGTYTFGGQVTIAKNGVTVFGVGKGTIIRTAGLGAGISYFFCGSNSGLFYNGVIRDIYCDLSNLTTSGYAINNNHNGTNALINLQVLGCYFTGSGSGGAITNDNPSAQSMLITGNYFLNWRDGQPALALGNAQDRVIGNYFSTTGTTSKFILSTNGIITNNQFILPASYNTKVIDGGLVVQSNYIVMPSGSAGASAMGISGCDMVTNNQIYLGSAPNVASIGIKNCNNITSNNIGFVGIGIAFDNANSSVILGNRISARADGINFTGASSSLVHTVDGNRITASLGNDNTYSGIVVANGILVTITGNYIYSTNNSNRIVYGIREVTNAAQTVIDGNWITGAVTEAISVQNPLSNVGHNITT